MTMLNNANNSKLDQAVKQTLTNYEAPFDPTDWSQMEKMLDAAPKSSNFKWSYSLNIFIGLTILGGFYLLYNSINSSKTPEKTIDSVSQPIKENKVTTSPEPTVKKPLPVVATPPKNVEPNTTTVVVPTEEKIIKSPETSIVKENKIDKKESAAAEKITEKKEVVVKENKEKNTKKQIVNPMGNEPIFGDMLDSSKGIIGKTKEKEVTKKAAKTTKPSSPIGWSSFISQNNLDSLKKYQEQQQKHTLKK